MHQLLLADLLSELPGSVRLQRAVDTLQAHFKCDGVGLLALDGDSLRLVAAAGLPREALGRRFVIARHPRFAAILARQEPTRFEPDSILPDPYDGLLDDRQGSPLPVHDCLGISLYADGRLWGALTLDALKVGTFDQPAQITLQHCSLLLGAAIRVTMLERENRNLRMLGSTDHGSNEITRHNEILGDSEPIRHLLHEIDIVADSDMPILLLGETGVGKELFARRLHRRSPRRQHPMVQVNCAALPESLAESELFGHVKGAFSGASSDRAGRFEAARGGTLFLDEVGELPLPIQAKLLRALQNGEIQRLGTDSVIKTDVRIVAATNRNLRKRVQDGSFRADLYHRLSVYPITIPPLRERGHDILLLAGHYLELGRSRLGLRGIRLSPDAEQALLAYHWPGNVRELEHAISRAAIKTLSQGGQRDQIMTLEPGALDLDLPHDHVAPGNGMVGNATDTAAANAYGGANGNAAVMVKADPADADRHASVGHHRPLRDIVESAQRTAILDALRASNHNWAHAARRLHVDSSNLHKLAKRLGIKSG